MTVSSDYNLVKWYIGVKLIKDFNNLISCFRVIPANKMHVLNKQCQFICGLCSFADKTKNLIDYHITVVHGPKVDQERINAEKCPSCKFIAPYSQLLKHMKTHIKYPLFCGFCDYESNTKDEMHNHIYEGHSKLRHFNTVQSSPTLEVAYRDGNGTLFCTCGGQFKTPEAMSRHQTVCQDIVIPLVNNIKTFPTKEVETENKVDNTGENSNAKFGQEKFMSSPQKKNMSEEFYFNLEDEFIEENFTQSIRESKYIDEIENCHKISKDTADITSIEINPISSFYNKNNGDVSDTDILSSACRGCGETYEMLFIHLSRNLGTCMKKYETEEIEKHKQVQIEGRKISRKYNRKSKIRANIETSIKTNKDSKKSEVSQESVNFCQEPQCDFKTKHKTSLRSHSRFIHARGTFKYCSMCDDRFASVCQLKVHKQVVHEGLQFRCDVCSYQGNRPNAVLSHKKKYHQVL